jgi:hypothetical protein
MFFYYICIRFWLNALSDITVFMMSRILKILFLLFFVSLPGYGAERGLYINEIQVANVDMFIDPSYNYGGWIEIYNPTDTATSLNGIVLRHTDAEGVVKTRILTADNGKVPAGGFKNIWFDHNFADGFYGPYAKGQIPFKMDADGGFIELLKSNGTDIIDAVNYPSAISRCSYMRIIDSADKWEFTSEPTPEASNNSTSIARIRLAAPVVDRKGGLFSDKAELNVTIPDNTTLYYTTDCSAPVPGKSKVSSDGHFVTDTTTIFRFMLVRENYLNSPVVTRSFIKYDKDFTLPILSVSTHPDNFFDDSIGIYVKGVNGRSGNNQSTKHNQNMDWERPVNMEYFVPEHGVWNEVLNQEATFSVFGGWTRFSAGNDDFECRTSFKLKANKIYEFNNFFQYPVFSTKPHIKLKSFLVRNGGQDPYCRIYDPIVQELVRTSGAYVDAQAWQPAHIFLNGKYLGMLNLREQSNRHFAYSNYGIDDDEIDQWENDWDIKAGDDKKLLEWYELATQRLKTSPTNDEIWQKIANLVDIDEYCYYMATEIYTGNKDWLRYGLKNIKGFRARTDDAKFHVVLHDLDAAYRDMDMIAQITKGTGKLVKIFNNMMKNPKFKKQFIDAYCIMGGSVFSPERCLPVIDSMTALTKPAMALEELSPMASADTLAKRISDREERYVTLIKDLKTTLGLDEPWDMEISSNIKDGKLLLNGLEIPTGKFNGKLFQPIVLTASAPAGYAFKEWQVDNVVRSSDSVFNISAAMAKGQYSVRAVYEPVTGEGAAYAPGASPVRINEVSAGNDIYINDYFKKSDWLELYNATDDDIDVAGMFLSDNRSKLQKYRITAPEGVSTIIPAHGYKIVWCDGKTPLTQLHASFKLDNSDDAFISLQAADGTWTDSLVYKAQSRWQTFGRYADGGNYAAVFNRPTIEQTNSLTVNTPLSLIGADTINTGIKPVVVHDSPIVAVEYYNLKGQRITQLPSHEIVIQKLIYANGEATSRKVRVE